MKISCLHDRYCIASFEPALSPESGEIDIILSSLKRAETMGYAGGLRESNQYDRMLGSTGRLPVRQAQPVLGSARADIHSAF